VSVTASVVAAGGGASSGAADGPVLSLYASITEPRPMACANGGRCFHATASQPGETVRLPLPASSLGCGARCVVHIDLAATQPANVTITAATQSASIQLQVGVPGCAMVRDGALTQYAVLLDPDEDVDDRLTLQLHLCSGKAELWAAPGGAPSLDQRVHEYSSSTPLLEPIDLPADR